jgi:hypothetical protein
MFPFLPGSFYGGVDRLPFVPTPEEEEDLRNSKRATLLQLWQQYSDLTYTGQLHGSGHTTRALRDAFAAEGIDLEVIYAEVVLMPSVEMERVDQKARGLLLQRLRTLHQQVVSRPVGAQILGYDVSYPVPGFHSFLFQPGLREQPEAPNLDVNEAGLLSTVQEAGRIVAVANAMTSSWRPFCGIAVYSVS